MRNLSNKVHWWIQAGLCILSLSAVSAQYEADDLYARLTEFPPVIVGHRHRDLHTTESRPSRYVERPSKLKRIKQKPLREDFESDENDDKEYTVSAHFQVNHPSPYSLQKSKKERPSSLFDPSQKSYSYANLHIATEKKHKESSTRPSKSKPHKKPIFKPVRPEFQSDLEIPSLKLSNVDPEHYEVSGIDQDPRSFKPNFQLQDVPNLYPREKQYRNVASKGQLDKYLEDQQKMLDEAIELQLLNDPNPISKGKYQQFLKAKDDERIEKEYEEEIRKPRPTYRPQFPRKSKSEAKKPIKKAPSPGLGHYRTPKGHGSYRFTLDI